MEIYKKVLFSSFAMAATSTVFAEEITAKHYDPFWEIILMGGIAGLDANNSSISVLNDEGNVVEIDKLVQTNEDDWGWGQGRLGLGYNYLITDEFYHDELAWFPIITPQFNLYYLAGDIDGEVYRYESEDFNDQSYDMDYSSTRLMLDLGLTIAAYEHFSIYGLGGIGVAWNSIDFDAKKHDPDCDCTVGLPNLESEDSTGFVYELGAGLSYAVVDDVTISLEYLYTIFENVQLGDNDEPFNVEGSDFDLHAQSVLLGVRVGL